MFRLLLDIKVKIELALVDWRDGLSGNKMSKITTSHSLTYTGYYEDAHRPVGGVVPVERLVTLYVNDQPLINLMCTPARLEDLALGFLFNEGLIEEMGEVERIETDDAESKVCVWLKHTIILPRPNAITSGCSGGVTFKDTFHERSRIESDVHITPQQATRLMQEFIQKTTLHRRAGGVHGAALAQEEQILCLAEDVGRHNALDKIAGACLRQGRSMQDCVLLVTGRLSFEMVDKAARMKISIIISPTSPTSLSIRLAQEWGLTLIGYTRRRSFRLYTGQERVI